MSGVDLDIKNVLKKAQGAILLWAAVWFVVTLPFSVAGWYNAPVMGCLVATIVTIVDLVTPEKR